MPAGKTEAFAAGWKLNLARGASLSRDFRDVLPSRVARLREQVIDKLEGRLMLAYPVFTHTY